MFSDSVWVRAEVSVIPLCGRAIDDPLRRALKGALIRRAEDAHTTADRIRYICCWSRRQRKLVGVPRAAARWNVAEWGFGRH